MISDAELATLDTASAILKRHGFDNTDLRKQTAAARQANDDERVDAASADVYGRPNPTTSATTDQRCVSCGETAGPWVLTAAGWNLSKGDLCVPCHTAGRRDTLAAVDPKPRPGVPDRIRRLALTLADLDGRHRVLDRDVDQAFELEPAEE